jgi:hypothetical protein
MNRPGWLAPSGKRMGAGRRWDSSSPSSALEDETVMEAVPDSKSGERVTAGGRVLRLPLMDGEAVRWQPPA